MDKCKFTALVSLRQLISIFFLSLSLWPEKKGDRTAKDSLSMTSGRRITARHPNIFTFPFFTNKKGPFKSAWEFHIFYCFAISEELLSQKCRSRLSLLISQVFSLESPKIDILSTFSHFGDISSSVRYCRTILAGEKI